MVVIFKRNNITPARCLEFPKPNLDHVMLIQDDKVVLTGAPGHDPWPEAQMTYDVIL